MTVEYLYGDHLSSTSITADSTGAIVSEMRYKPSPLRLPSGVLREGETRYAWTSGASTTPAYKLSNYTFTGQYSYMDDPATAAVTEGFGLMFCNARWYDPALGRFAQADTIIPGGVQGLDRYAYVNNSPTNYTDPSGHRCVPVKECGGHKPGGVALKTRAKQLIDFSKSMGMTPEEVIGIGLGREMFGDNEEERKIHMDAFRNGFLGYANDPSSHCNGNPTYNCMLHYFSSAYESVYNQFLENGVPVTHWETRDEYIFQQAGGNLSENIQDIVALGVEFMVGSEFTGSFMDTISAYSFDPSLAVSSGVVDAQALYKYLHGYPTSADGFLVVKSVTCPNTGAAGYTLYYNMTGMWALTSAGLGVC
jgi:RHS repeat-associated protein